MANINSLNDAYHSNREAMMRQHPKDVIPSYDQLKHKIEEITGGGLMSHPMCKNSYVAFTGSFSNLNVCPQTGASKFFPKTNKVYQEFVTIPIGPVLQALWHSPASAKQLSYHQSRT